MPWPDQVDPSGNGSPGHCSISARTSSGQVREVRDELDVATPDVQGAPLLVDRRSRPRAAAGGGARSAPRRTRGAPRRRPRAGASSARTSRRPADPARPRPRTRRTSRIPCAGPRAVSRAISGSSWSVKNWNGAVSPYSSPMNSSGTCGAKSVHAAASAAHARIRRSPSGAVADLVVVLRADHEPLGRLVLVARGRGRRPCRTARSSRRARP